MAISTPVVIGDVLGDLESKGVDVHSERIRRAVEVAQGAYKDKMHWSGESVEAHVAGVLKALERFEPDEDAIIACILHHVLLSEELTLTALEDEFGPIVRSLVSGAHLLSHVTVQGRRASIEDLRLMLLTVSDDMRTVLINLCDRCYLLSRLDKIPAEERRRVCQDILNLFAPVAARLGIYSIKNELESGAFPVLYPHDAERIHEQVNAMQREFGDFLSDVGTSIKKYLAEKNLPSRVLCRQKSPYSLFVKMNSKSITYIQDVYDLFAMRVIVDSVEECYQVLGLLHQWARPVSHRFKDYISFPKPNGYQSLHTTLTQIPGLPPDIMVEVQVRTKQMHRESEYGIAAHWSYKTYGDTDLAAYHAQLQQMLASQEPVSQGDASHLVDHIFVLTPKGDVIELPEGATPLDFAFMVHTDVGLSFRGAKVNGMMVSNTTELENGDIVEILRYREPRPSSQWLNLLKLSSARAKLKRYLYSKDRPQLISSGRELLNEELRKHDLPSLDNDLSIMKSYDGQRLNMAQREDLLVKIGQGAERPSSTVMHLDTVSSRVEKPQNATKDTVIPASDGKTVRLEGGVPMPMRFAKCCKADSSDRSRIVGVANRSGIVIIHRETCGMLRNANPERLVEAQWVNS